MKTESTGDPSATQRQLRVRVNPFAHWSAWVLFFGGLLVTGVFLVLTIRYPSLELVRHEAEANGIGSVAVLRFSNSTPETLCLIEYIGGGRASVGYLFQVEHQGHWYEVESLGMPRGAGVVGESVLELKPDESTEITASIPAYATGARVGIEYWTRRSPDRDKPSFRARLYQLRVKLAGLGLGSRPTPKSAFRKQQIWFDDVLRPPPEDEQ